MTQDVTSKKRQRDGKNHCGGGVNIKSQLHVLLAHMTLPRSSTPYSNGTYSHVLRAEGALGCQISTWTETHLKKNLDYSNLGKWLTWIHLTLTSPSLKVYSHNSSSERCWSLHTVGWAETWSVRFTVNFGYLVNISCKTTMRKSISASCLCIKGSYIVRLAQHKDSNLRKSQKYTYKHINVIMLSY